MLLGRSRGAVMLAQLGLTEKEIAFRCQRTRSAVGHWLTGHARPDADMRLTLRALYAIPVEAWSESASAVTPQQRVER